MTKFYRNIDRNFEKLASFAIALLGNSITYLIAFSIVIFWLTNKEFYKQNIHDSIRDVIVGVTFLSLFIIQKSFNRFSASLHLKVNELVSSHEPARNFVINMDEKTEYEINELSKEYTDLEERVKEVEKEQI